MTAKAASGYRQTIRSACTVQAHKRADDHCDDPSAPGVSAVFEVRPGETQDRSKESTSPSRTVSRLPANAAPAENLIHAGGSRCKGGDDDVRRGGRRWACVTGSAVAG